MTVQSVTCQPRMPSRSVSRTVVLHRRVKNASGMEPSSTSRRNVSARVERRRLDAQPDGGEERVAGLPSHSTAAPVPAGRSTQIVVVSRKSTSMPYSVASVAWMTSFWTSP